MKKTIEITGRKKQLQDVLDYCAENNNQGENPTKRGLSLPRTR